jgi:mRNA interferase RelE/StbE
VIVCLYKKTFLKDLSKVRSDSRERIEKLVFDKIPNSDKSLQTLDIRKMKGYEDYYRIRLGDYRIGCKIEEGHKIIFYRIKNRNDIYKVFP